MQVDDLLLDRPLGDQSVDRHRGVLANPVGPIRRLVLDGGIPPGIEVYDIVGRRKVEPDSAGFERDQKDIALHRPDRLDSRRYAPDEIWRASPRRGTDG